MWIHLDSRAVAMEVGYLLRSSWYMLLKVLDFIKSASNRCRATTYCDTIKLRETAKAKWYRSNTERFN